MAVTPNYGWPVPVATDLVKDGYSAIANLGDAIDATVFALPSGGLTLIKTQTIGTAVTGVTVTDAFSATYDNYKIFISGGIGTGDSLFMRLGASGVTNYNGATIWANTTQSALSSYGTNNQVAWRFVGFASSASTGFAAEVRNPFLETRTYCEASFNDDNNVYYGRFTGKLSNALSYTDFTIYIQTGTMTGGTIYVYGYQK